MVICGYLAGIPTLAKTNLHPKQIDQIVVDYIIHNYTLLKV